MDDNSTSPSIPTNVQEKLVAKANRSPAWAGLANHLIQHGIHYGSVLSTNDLEAVLECERSTAKFQMIICQLRTLLLKEGFYLTSRGQKGEQYIVLSAAENAEVIEGLSERATHLLQRGILLGKETKRERLTIEERRKHDAVLEKMAHKLVLLKKSEEVWNHVYKAPDTDDTLTTR